MSISAETDNTPEKKFQAEPYANQTRFSSGRTESVDEFLARGGKITSLPAVFCAPVAGCNVKPDLTPIVEKKNVLQAIRWGKRPPNGKLRTPADNRAAARKGARSRCKAKLPMGGESAQ